MSDTIETEGMDISLRERLSQFGKVFELYKLIVHTIANLGGVGFHLDRLLSDSRHVQGMVEVMFGRAELVYIEPAKVAFSGATAFVRSQAIKQLHDDEQILSLITPATDHELAQELFCQVSDKRLLIRWYKKNRKTWLVGLTTRYNEEAAGLVIWSLFHAMNPRDLVKVVNMNVDHESEQLGRDGKDALRCIKDQQVLYYLCKTGRLRTIRNRALAEIRDVEILEKLRQEFPVIDASDPMFGFAKEIQHKYEQVC